MHPPPKRQKGIVTSMESTVCKNVSKTSHSTDNDAIMSDETGHKKRKNTSVEFEEKEDTIPQLGNVYDCYDTNDKEFYVQKKLMEEELLKKLDEYDLSGEMVEEYNRRFNENKSLSDFLDEHDRRFNLAMDQSNNLAENQLAIIEKDRKSKFEEERIKMAEEINMAYIDGTLTQEMLTECNSRFNINITFDMLKEHNLN
jgi:hypothetical protein